MNNKIINLGIIGLGQIGSRLFKEIISKKKDIQTKTGKKINILGVSAKSFNKKRSIRFSNSYTTIITI